MRHSPTLTAAFATLVLFAPGCTPQETEPTGQVHSSSSPAAADKQREGTVFHLEGRHGAPEALWVEASYKIRREAGQLSKTLEIDVEHAPPGVAHALTLDGFKLGKLVTSAKGKAEFELTEAGEDYFPEGFEEPRDGSLLHIGELAEIRLLTVHKLTDLQVDIAGPGTLAGKVGYKIERIGDATTTEFQVKVSQAGAKSIQPVQIDGVHVGDLNVDLAGKGKLLYSTLDGEPFPPGFQAPRVGSTVEVGQLYKGQLRDNLVDRGE